MEAIRKVVGTMTGEAGGRTSEEQTRGGEVEPSSRGAAAGAEEWQQQQQQQRGYGEQQPTTTAETTYARGGEEKTGRGVTTAGEREPHAQAPPSGESEVDRQQRLSRPPQIERERGAPLRETDVSAEQRLQRERETARGEKGVGEKIKEGLGLGGAAEKMAKSEETRQLGYEQGQVPYENPAESMLVRERYAEERAAIKGGRPYEGQRLKDPEHYRTVFQRTPEEAKLSERRWEERCWAEHGGEAGTRRGKEEEEEGFFGRTVHEIERAIGILPGGPTVLSGVKRRSVSSVTAYPLCLRVLLHPRPDIHDSELEGDIIFVQNHPNAPTQVIGSCRGIAPGLHGMVILENGDLSLLRSSAGLHFDAPGSTASHGGANTKERHLGDLGNIVVKDDGVSFFNFTVDELPLIDVAGRSLAVMSGEDDLGRSECQCAPGTCKSAASGPHTQCGPDCAKGAAGGCFACVSIRTGNAGHALGLGHIVRTDVRAMERLKNIQLGVGVGQTTHREVVGRPMNRRPAERERGEVGWGRETERERRERGEKGGWQQIKESVKSTLGVGERERERAPERERYRAEPEEYGRQPTRRHEYVGEERQAARPYAESYLGGKEEPRGYGRPYEQMSSKGQREYPSREEYYGAPSSRTSYEQPERIRGSRVSGAEDIGSKMQYQQRSSGGGRGSGKFEEEYY